MSATAEASTCARIGPSRIADNRDCMQGSLVPVSTLVGVESRVSRRSGPVRAPGKCLGWVFAHHGHIPSAGHQISQ